MIDEAAEAQYNIRRRHPENAVYYEHYERESALARQALACELDVRYGPHPDETLDIFPATSTRNPVLVFFHGGYWRALDKRDFSFIAPAFVAAGYSVVVANYALAPTLSVAAITDQAVQALQWIAANLARMRGDASALFVAGHSAGAQLAAMTLRADRGWGIRAAIGLSGVYDLVPLLATSINEALRLDRDAASAVSPARLNVPAGCAPMLVLVGGGETAGFIDQSCTFAAHWGATVPGTDLAVVPDLNHYTIMLDFARRDSAVHARALRFLQDAGNCP